MYKKIVFAIISFFLFTFSVSAAKVDSITIDTLIDAEGNATITEVWQAPMEINTKDLTRRFYQAKDITIHDITIRDADNNEYKEVSEWNSKGKYIFKYDDNGFKKSLKFYTTGQVNTYTITYKVDNIISKFDDLYGLNFYFYVSNSSMSTDLFDLYIDSEIKYTQANTAVYANGKNIRAGFENGKIHVMANDLVRSNKIYVIAALTGINYPKYRVINGTADSINKRYSSKLVIIDEMISAATSRTAKIIFAIFGVLMVIFIIKSLIKRAKGFDEYAGIDTYNHKSNLSINDVPYFDSIPCNGNLYKIAFIGGYYRIYKNRSNLVGALLLKWIYAGYIRIIKDDSKKCLKLIDGPFINDQLDKDLYDMLVEAASYYQLDNSRLTQYASSHYMRFMTWFNMGFANTLNDEINRGHIKKVKKFKKIIKVMDQSIEEDAVRILGLKKYLLNFNQVPRQSELTPEAYEYMLIIAELLGIGDAYAREILRKNPDNVMAQQLLDLESLNYIYKGVYNNAVGPYKQIVRNSRDTVAADNDTPTYSTTTNNNNNDERHSKL